MTDEFDSLILGGTTVSHRGIVAAGIGVKDGRIAAFGDLRGATAAEVVDASGLHVFPGVIDTQVHFREPGAEHKEDLESGSRAAVMGGVTGVFEMPNTNPSTSSVEALQDKLARAKGRMWCDHAFFGGATTENIDDLAAIENEPGCAGIKMFMGSSTGNLLVADDENVLKVLKAANRRMAVHSEDEDRLNERMGVRRKGDPSSHPDWRDPETALRCTERLVRLAREAGRRIHVLHTTTADEIPVLAANKDLATVEVTPQHLTLVGPEIYERLGTYAQMNPPIRDESHRQALWQGISDGVVDVIGSDHAPHSREEKDQDYPDSPSGMPGVQTLVPIMLSHIAEGRLNPLRFMDLTSAGPARIYGIAGKGRIAIGYDADFTIVDLKRRHTIENSWIESKCGWTPFDGVTVTGWPVGTIIRGNKVMWQGERLGKALGEPVRFQETL